MLKHNTEFIPVKLKKYKMELKKLIDLLVRNLLTSVAIFVSFH